MRHALLALAAIACLAGGARAADPSLQFTRHEMSTLPLPLRDGEFAMRSASAPATAWTATGDAALRVMRTDAPGHRTAAFVEAQANSEGPAGLQQRVAIPAPRPGTAAYSVSAWVWSDKPGSAYLRLADGGGNEALSAFHSGGSRWEYLTVVFPYDLHASALAVELLTREGAARFSGVRALATYDDRFTKALPDGCNPLRERTTYVHSDRVRIVVVGNSTVNGHAVADKRATFPYVLQLKLEAAFPGRFEVFNFGLCGWHLPPQVVTLDNAYNDNKACDGAAWCGGKEGQFTHRNMLATPANADHNSPTLRQMSPDVIIFAGMWNDVWRALKYAPWGIPPNPDEVNRIGDEPASVAYLRSVFEYMDDPTPERMAAADLLFAEAMKPLDAATLAGLEFHDRASLAGSAQFQALADNAAMKLHFLARQFLDRGTRKSRMWTVVLPGRFGAHYEDAANKMVAAGLLPAAQRERFLMDGYIDALTERIQQRELEMASREAGARIADLSDEFHREYGTMAMGRQFSLGYFLQNVEDNVHFAYRGNEWIADRIFLDSLDELEELSRRKPHGR